MEEWFTLIIMGLALGLDAFSLSVGLGMMRIDYRQVFNVGVAVGLFHVIMPLIGLVLGQVLSQYIGVFAYIISGLVLLLIGIQMIASSFSNSDVQVLKPFGWGLMLFAFSVSIDSFSVGLSLGMLGAETVVTVASFGLISMFLTWFGLGFGRYVGHWFGSHSEMLGGGVLIAFGLKILFTL
ncbi:manganese efflux pump MntP family protein [Texcoconibacillus texcoconensis]|uniref:Putative manganese efflux pump MntP n=1 Tax=Texcoconibacillus texcoconensis TaxID=1095777 RepID=A0A840QS30_9BACI|nr:manganese efflux pump MntP family protein [Texcoconibacillus texcoconensis]MBB5174087.1 putative Mn2+ efflux pump MntP [Texcoconibacillus texcoconensis]